MYVDFSTIRGPNGHTYRRVLLRESFRQDGKVCKRTFANLSHLPEKTIRALQLAFQHDDDLAPLAGAAGLPFELHQGQSLGAFAVVLAVAERLGLPAALGHDRQGKLALYQVIARVLDQGSRLSAVRLAKDLPVAELLGLGGFDEDDLYANLDWLYTQQTAVEDYLFRRRLRTGQPPQLFLYDVTSTYLEGVENELAAFGYNRDGKHGKMQIVVGLLTDEYGEPLSIELFPGNTGDPATVPSQLSKLVTRFQATGLTLVGDRGMLRLPQQQLLAQNELHYITAVTKPQIEALLKRGLIQLELFDEDLAEVTDDATAVRYILRRNPAQARLLEHRRSDQLRTWQGHLDQWNERLAQHPRCRVATAVKELTARAAQLHLSAWVKVTAEGRGVTAQLDPELRAEAAQFDGCYVLKTDLPAAQAPAPLVDARYHDLSKVEWAFRSCKSQFLELRPIYLRNEERTRAHALVVMLAYRLTRHLAECWREFDLTVEEALVQLGQLCVTEVRVPGHDSAYLVPKPRPPLDHLLAAAGVVLPAVLPPKPARVDTKRKLTSRRKRR